MQYNINIMNHQVEYYIDIGAPFLEDIQPVGFNKQRIGDNILERDNNGIKPFQVTDLDDQAM